MKIQNLFILIIVVLISFSCSGNPDSYVEEGIRYMNSGQYTEAAVRFKTALEKDPKHFKANFALGVLYKRVKKLDKALELLSKANRYDPKNEEAATALAYIFIQKKQYDTAIRVLSPLSSAPKNPEVYFYLGDANHKKKKYKEALKWLKKTLRILTIEDKTLIKNSYALVGDCYLALNKLDEGREFLQGAASGSKNPVVYAKLGATLFRMSNNFHVKTLEAQNKIEAINEKAEEIKSKSKKKKYLAENEETLLLLKKDIDEFGVKRDNLLRDTVKVLKDGLKLLKKGGDKVTKRETYYYLGMSYLLLKKYKDSKENLLKFLQNGPKGPEAKDVRNKLDKLNELIRREEQKKLDEELKKKEGK